MLKNKNYNKKYSYLYILPLIIIITLIWFSIKLKLQLNIWTGDFYNLIQHTLENPNKTKSITIYKTCFNFILITFSYSALKEIIVFLSKIYTLRLRAKMNSFFLSNWNKFNFTEGAAQRVQEDAAIFTRLLDFLVRKLVAAIFIIIIFTPVVIEIGSSIATVPIIGTTKNAVIKGCFFFTLVGTLITTLVAKNLPKTETIRQQQEAQYRKRLVEQEQVQQKTDGKELESIYALMQKNYYLLYRNYFLINCVKEMYFKISYIAPYIMLSPTIVTGAISIGLIKQIVSGIAELSDALSCCIKVNIEIAEMLAVISRLSEIKNLCKTKVQYET